MITIPSKPELKTLMTTTGTWCVSFYMATHRAGPEVQQDPVRLRKWLKSAEKQLVEAGMRVPDAAEFVQPALDLVDRPGFWRDQGDGLAIFIGPKVMQYYRLPISVNRLLVIANRFHLKPLLPLLAEDSPFYVLALSQNNVELFKGSRYQFKPVTLREAPSSLAETLRQAGAEQQQQWHSRTDSPGASGRRAAVFYGIGGATDEEAKTNIWRYFQRVDNAVSAALAGENAPLVLAGVESVLPIYREASSYNNLVEPGITGNPERLRPDELHTQARQILHPKFQAARAQAAERYRQFAGKGNGQASSNLQQILQAAAAGRVETLFVPEGMQQWGAFHASTGEIELSDIARVGDQDLLDLAAIQTYLNGGTVFVVKLEQVPSHELVAAVFRY